MTYLLTYSDLICVEMLCIASIVFWRLYSRGAVHTYRGKYALFLGGGGGNLEPK